MASNEELAVQLQQGDMDALSPLWEQISGLCYKLAFRFFDYQRSACASAGVALEDVQQESFFAVLDAARAYDPDKGWKFSTYLHYPLQNRFNALIGYRWNAPPKPLNSADSLDKLLNDADEGGGTRGDMIPDPAAEAAFDGAELAEYERQLQTAVQEALALLPPLERDTVHLHYMKGLTLREAGQRLGISFNCVRRLDKNATKHLRSGQAFTLLKSFAVDYGRAYNGTGFGAWEWKGSIEERLTERGERKWWKERAV